jgi:uroporphyrinogen decarboxylase
VRKSKPGAKIIGFPRAATETGYLSYARSTGVDALSIDTAASMRWAAASLAPAVALQGNLDPIALIAGGSALDRAVDEILAATQGKPFVFNLGHGILPETPPDNVTRLVNRIRGRA